MDSARSRVGDSWRLSWEARRWFLGAEAWRKRQTLQVGEDRAVGLPLAACRRSRRRRWRGQRELNGAALVFGAEARRKRQTLVASASQLSALRNS
jgi:hypothetical protein